MAEYVKIRSWHVVKLVSRASWNITYCGRIVKPPTEVLHDFPMEGRSCETCLRISRNNEDRLPE